MQNEFVNIAAHELRTPTQAIVGYSEILDQSRERSTHYEEASRTAART
jgi:two-component system, OmpR family, sensor histidine kinase VicK